MGIYGALSSAVSGMRAQGFALEAISGNIANSQTTAYKRTETQFMDLVADAPLQRQLPGAVIANAKSTNDINGDIQTVSNATYIALNNDGFFIVEPKAGESDGNAIFNGTDLYTRRGDFELDKDGRLVNGAGYYLKGMPVDRTSGNISGSVPEPIQVSNSLLEARYTRRIDYSANLPEIPLTANYDPDDPTTALYTHVDGAPEADVLAGTIEGGAITAYTEKGAPIDVQMRWGKTSVDDATGEATWTLYYSTETDPATGDGIWEAAEEFQFGSDGQLADGAPDSIELAGVMMNGTDPLVVNFGERGLTQFDDANGTANVTTLKQDGYGAGDFVSVQISDSGRVVASYSNGQRVDVAQVATAEFSANNKLKRLDGGVYEATTESGEAIVGLTGAGIVGGALEASNTDISDEFTKLIVTQQAYAAGTRIVTTADEMLQEALNMVR